MQLQGKVLTKKEWYSLYTSKNPKTLNEQSDPRVCTWEPFKKLGHISQRVQPL